MFKRRVTYMMEIDAEIHFPLEDMRRSSADFAALADDEQRALLAESLTRQVHDVAAEELRRHGLRQKRSFEHQGHRWETGSEIMVNRLGEHHVTFTVVCEGDCDNAVAASDGWFARVATFGGIASIGRVALRGTDGTNAQRYSDETVAAVESLDEETLAKIDELMDPGRSGPRASSSPNRIALHGATPKKVLLIEDEAPIRLLFRVNLEAEGMEVVEAADGPTGIEKAIRESPDLILLDVMMPGLDGWRVAEQLRENPATRDIPFVFATPRKEYRDRAKGLDLGAVDYIPLPCDPVQLALRVQELLACTHDELEAG
jgi:CheY-like chemotaxis protein